MPNYSGIWSRSQQFQGRRQGLWPAGPGAPTIGTVTVASATSVSVPFTAPACAGVPATITGYTATSTPGCITGTAASSPITISGLTTGTAYTFKVKAQNIIGFGPCSAASNSVTPAIPISCATFTTPGTFSWVAPTGVTSVAVVTVGGGGGSAIGRSVFCCCAGVTYYQGGEGGGGGGLGYLNGIPVTPGTSYTVTVGAGGNPTGCSTSAFNGGTSSFISTSTVGATGGSGGSSNSRGQGGNKLPLFGFTCVLGGYGGSAGFGASCDVTPARRGGGGGGAGGYNGGGLDCHGRGSNGGCACGAAGFNGGGGGGGGTINVNASGGGGGGVGLFGSGTSGAGGSPSTPGGRGGSGGSNASVGAGGAYGGGAGGRGGGNIAQSRAGANGAVRIVWAIAGFRGTPSFPSTNVGA